MGVRRKKRKKGGNFIISREKKNQPNRVITTKEREMGIGGKTGERVLPLLPERKEEGGVIIFFRKGGGRHKGSWLWNRDLRVTKALWQKSYPRMWEKPVGFGKKGSGRGRREEEM